MAHEMFGLPYIIFRPPNVYGERQTSATATASIIGIFMNQTVRRLRRRCAGPRLQLYRRCRPAHSPRCATSQSYGEIYNVGGGTPCTVNQRAGAVSEAMDAPIRVEHSGAGRGIHAYSDRGKTRSILEVDGPSAPLIEGLARLAMRARNHGPRTPVTFSDIGIARNMPPSWRTLATSPF